MLTSALVLAAAGGGGGDVLGVGRTSVLVTAITTVFGILVLIVALRLVLDKKSTGDFRHHGSSFGTIVLDVLILSLGALIIAGGTPWGQTIIQSVFAV